MIIEEAWDHDLRDLSVVQVDLLSVLRKLIMPAVAARIVRGPAAALHNTLNSGIICRDIVRRRAVVYPVKCRGTVIERIVLTILPIRQSCNVSRCRKLENRNRIDHLSVVCIIRIEFTCKIYIVRAAGTNCPDPVHILIILEDAHQSGNGTLYHRLIDDIGILNAKLRKCVRRILKHDCKRSLSSVGSRDLLACQIALNHPGGRAVSCRRIVTCRSTVSCRIFCIDRPAKHGERHHTRGEKALKPAGHSSE